MVSCVVETVSPLRQTIFSAKSNLDATSLSAAIACSMELGVSEPVRRMKGASSPPAGPFGYALISPQDTPFDAAPACPPGPALLDDSESNMLDSLFTSLNASQLDSNDFWLSIAEHGGNTEQSTGGDILNWPELPPNFEGSATNLPPQQLHHIQANKQQSELLHCSNRPELLSSDVLAAAQMLYQNGNDQFAPSKNSIYTHHNMVNDHNAQKDYSNHPADQQHQHQHEQDSKRAQHVSYDGGRTGITQKVFVIPKGVHTSTMIFDHAAHRNHQPDPNPSVKMSSSMLQWGSDAGFAHQGYRLPPGQPTVEETTDKMLINLTCLQAQSSAANTRASSPARNQAERHNLNALSAASFNVNTSPHEDRPKKRRKSNNKIKEEDAEFAGAFTYSKTPSSSTPSTTISRPSSSRKAKASSPNAGPAIKPTRENLSEEQKRTNHILSEQKRRNLIKQGFNDLCALVPELKGGGYSKSTMLTQAGDWLADLLAGNELLKAQLAELKARGS